MKKERGRCTNDIIRTITKVVAKISMMNHIQKEKDQSQSWVKSWW